MRNSLGKINLKLSKAFIPICAALVLLSLYCLEHRHRLNARTRIYDEQKAQFRVIEGVNGVHTFTDVCIETLAPPKLETSYGIIFNETKRIVSYGYHSQADGARITIKVTGPPDIIWPNWEVDFRRGFSPVNKSCKYLRDTAFFVQPTFAGNFHHFFIDEFVPLYSVVVLSNRLHPGARNQILYRTPQIGSEDDRDHSRRTYEGFLRTLYIDDFHDVFYNLPNNTCFRQVVFGSRPLLFRQRDVIDHVLSYYNLTMYSNRNASNLYVTVLARKYRRIINTEEVLSFAKEVGFQNLRIVDFSGKSIRYQLQIMSTSNVFIGIHGAGLQWSVFMPEDSHLIELAWPQKHWGFYYNGYAYVRRFGIKWRGVGVQDVRLNWTSYAANVRRGVPVTDKEKPILIRNHPESVVDNIWKWCDIVVQRNEILETLKNAYKETRSIH